MLVELKSVRREPVLVEYIFSSNELSICASVQICARASIVPVASNVLERVNLQGEIKNSFLFSPGNA